MGQLYDYCFKRFANWEEIVQIDQKGLLLWRQKKGCLLQKFRGGGTDLERGYGDVRPWRPPFHASPVVRKGPISSKRVSSQDPLLRKFGNYSLYSLNFHPNFSSQAPKFGNFQLTSPQIWKFSVHKPPNLEIFSTQAPSFRAKYQFASPTPRKSGPHTPTWKKVECPPMLLWSQKKAVCYRSDCFAK